MPVHKLVHCVIAIDACQRCFGSECSCGETVQCGKLRSGSLVQQGGEIPVDDLIISHERAWVGGAKCR